MSEQEGSQEKAAPPATFREVFGVVEYRCLFTAAVLSWIGDYFARVAVTVLIFSGTGSALLSAAGFAVSYLPWVVGGPVLAALAERYPYRRVMILCDVARLALVALMALPGLPLPALLLLLLASSLLTPPFEAARSAMLAQILTGDRYVVGLSVQNMVAQAAQVAGYALGGVTAAAVDGRVALLINAATFGASALLLWRGVRPRPAAAVVTPRRSLLKETGDGITLVFGHRVMRPIALVVFSMVAIQIVPEGLAAAWSAELDEGPRTAGLLMAAMPIGNVIGTLCVRVIQPARRLKLIKPVLLASPLFLVPALADPPFIVVFFMGVCTGVTAAVIMPLNGLFVSVLPGDFRARAFGIMQGGMQISFAVAVLTAGALAESFSVPVVVGAWGVCGLVLMAVAVRTWPGAAVIDAEVARAADLNRRTSPAPIP